MKKHGVKRDKGSEKHRGIPKGTKTNFETLCKAVINDDVCIMDAQDRETGKPVVLICAVNRSKDGGFEMIPLAIMVDGNPFEQFNPPKAEGGYYQPERVTH